ncbi:MAG: Rrf2 family transcriptional regulator [Moraxellaceae bacterium]|nr:Rrf2 family transcriptional regulator [Moraxellaceae bacterium]
MKLTKQTDFALRTLLYLSNQEIGTRVFAQEIANAYGMPVNHLTKIVNKLANLGYIRTYRGRNGGIELGKKENEIFVRDVIIDFEPSLEPADCANCQLNINCKLQKQLDLASQAFLNALNEVTLADIK